MKTTETLNPPIAPAFHPRPLSSLLGGALQIGTSVYQLLAAAVFIAALLLANGWLKTPFIGALYSQTLIVNGGAPTGASDAWHLYSQGIRPGDKLVSVDAVPVQTTAEVQSILKGLIPGESIPVAIHAASGADRTVDVKLATFPPEDRTAYFVLPSIVSFLFLGISLGVFGLRRTESTGRSIAILSASLSIVSGALFDLSTTHALILVWILGIVMTGGAMIDLALSFPREANVVRGRPYLRWLGYLVALVLFVYALSAFRDQTGLMDQATPWRWIYAFTSVSVIAYVLLNLLRASTARSPVVKTQARMILAGAVVAFGPVGIWLLISELRSAAFTPYAFLPIVLFPLTIAYEVLRFRLVRADDWARRGLVYLLLSIFIVGAYALIVTGLSLIFKNAMPASNPLWIGGLVFILAVLLDPIRLRLQGVVDRTFFRGQRAYAEILQNFTHDLTGVLDLPAISRVLRQLITSTLAPSVVHIFAYDALTDQYVALPDENNRSTSDVHFSSGGALAQHFARERIALYLDETPLPAGLQADETRLKLLGARLLVGLPGHDRPVGWLAMGTRLTGQPYEPRDLNFIERLADQASGAIRRVQTVANLERRVQEMNALTRVSQGVNITLTFDDVLELIYAQTSQIIPVSDFYITLFNRDNDYFYLGFAVRNKERLTARENLPLPPKVGFEPEIIRRGRPYQTQEYGRECQARGLAPIAEGLSAWMGVPLNAGAESIGALSIASRDPGTTYTPGQLELLQAIADQTAGAIVKARLLRETQERASQLGKLNDVTRQLASTLELEPLLQYTVEGAVGILNAEAGLFYLLDQQTGDLVVRATSGPLGRDLVGQHLTLEAGIASRALAAHGPVLENDLQPGMSGHGLSRASGGFNPHTGLAVPLQVKEAVLGVLEIMNRRDGLPFVETDQTLLTAFASQASVAMENVRLYTLTDQELTARVEELSVMQRIDRELNASLELDRAMRITLDWALRRSNSEAGFIGMLEQEKLRVVAQEGYGEALGGTADQKVALTLPGFQAAIESGQPQRVQFEAGGERGFLPTSDHRFVIPIRREASVIGLLVLESTGGAQEDLAFLSRLSDHAAIAISNAQLYDAVQRADLAKSDFVSLVAHELKNPMTSIKGYTELLAAGAVGPVNEMQANFLNTIRSNTERMSTLVSDLNDNSKIEAGRLRLEFRSVEVSDLVDEVMRSTKRQLEDKKQTIQTELPPELPQVWGDRTRLGQVLTNLVSNANKYTPEGGLLIIGAEASANHWDPGGAARVVHVWLKDNGIGITPEDQQRIFEKFFRSEDPKARESPGAGLGLNITRSLVEMQGGRIWFESQHRKGTTFHFTVPVAEG